VDIPETQRRPASPATGQHGISRGRALTTSDRGELVFDSTGLSPETRVNPDGRNQRPIHSFLHLFYPFIPLPSLIVTIFDSPRPNAVLEN